MIGIIFTILFGIGVHIFILLMFRSGIKTDNIVTIDDFVEFPKILKTKKVFILFTIIPFIAILPIWYIIGKEFILYIMKLNWLDNWKKFYKDLK